MELDSKVSVSFWVTCLLIFCSCPWTRWAPKSHGGGERCDQKKVGFVHDVEGRCDRWLHDFT